MRFTEFKGLKIKYDESNIIKYREKSTIKVKDVRTKLNDEGIYEVYPIAVHKKQLYIICPYCNQIHIHGDAKGTIPGYRNTICIGPDGSRSGQMYYIKEVINHV